MQFLPSFAFQKLTYKYIDRLLFFIGGLNRFRSIHVQAAGTVCVSFQEAVHQIKVGNVFKCCGDLALLTTSCDITLLKYLGNDMILFVTPGGIRDGALLINLIVAFCGIKAQHSRGADGLVWDSNALLLFSLLLLKNPGVASGLEQPLV